LTKADFQISERGISIYNVSRKEELEKSNKFWKKIWNKTKLENYIYFKKQNFTKSYLKKGFSMFLVSALQFLELPEKYLKIWYDFSQTT
jgi:hypothetical protein